LTLPLGLLALRLTFSETARRSAFGLLAGAGALCLFVAWLQQGGNNLDAQPWLASGLAFTLSGVLAHARHGD
jgi:hypothetical protein